MENLEDHPNLEFYFSGLENHGNSVYAAAVFS